MNPKASILQLGSCSRRQCCQHFNLLRSIINSKDLNYHRHVIIDTHQLIESQQFVLFIRLYFLAFQLDNTPYKDSVNHVLRHAISERRVLLTVFGPKVSPAQKSVGAPRGALVMVYKSLMDHQILMIFAQIENKRKQTKTNKNEQNRTKTNENKRK